MTKKLDGKVAVITGATSGMALATAKLFVQEGAYVFITGRRQEQLDAAVRGIGKNVAGVLGAITEANVDNTFNVNVKGTLFTVQKALSLMRDGGSIIMTGSIASAKGFPGFSVYNASKAAIRSFARTWTVDLKDRHIRVNVISPGTIDTGVFVGVPKEVKDQFVSIIPMGRIGQPHEIATAALFLASKESGFVTGIELFVDGGAAQI
jgi:NAD(P)-dependent dehydrogenase (short-subunit alcohol dehydrogenase family)